MEYNAQQRAAITAPLGPMVIIAGPGTGKTATIVGRIVYVIERHHIPPEKILAISFTRKAAAELKKRLAQPHVLATTIHSLALLILHHSQPKYTVTAETLDQLIPDCVALLKKQPDQLHAAQQRWQYICVDEFQDVDSAQAELITLLAAKHHQLCVVGDPDQSIYGFRGARLDVLLGFRNQYSEARQYILSDNYRSQARIVEAASGVIRHNRERIDHAVVSLRSVQNHIVTFQADSSYAEAKAVVENVQSLVGASDHLALEQGQTAAQPTAYSFEDIAILYRLNVVGDTMEKVLRDSGLPYHRIGAKGVLELATVQDYLAQLPQQLLLPTQTLAQQLPVDLLTDDYIDFRLLVESWNDLPAEAARTALLDYACIARPEDDWQPGRNAITLLTAHAAKGLEFSVVFMVGADDGIFPYTIKADCDVAEERRLFYVAMTRARDTLYISSARQRALFGQTAARTPSRFLAEVPADTIVVETLPVQPARPKQSKLF